MKRTAGNILKLLAVLGLIVALMMSSVIALAEEPPVSSEDSPAAVEESVAMQESASVAKKAPKAAASISKKQAKKLALKEAGVKSSAVTKWVKVKLDGNEWDVEFKTKKFVFEMDINAATGAVSDFEKTEIKTKITKDKAKSAALSRAGVKSGDVKKWVKVKLDGDEWDVEFTTKSAKYDVEIDAYTAEVRSFETEEIVRERISEDKAKSAALKKAGVKEASVKQWIKVLLDGDEWDVEFETEKYKFDVEIDAYSGKVKDYEKKALPRETISEADAKAAALEKAGVESSDVKKWTKVKLDDDEWDVEFKTEKYKYEVEINAYTGKVKDFEKKKITTSAAAKLSLADAKKIALDHAKGETIITSQVKYTKAKLDRDGSRMTYEIEFTYRSLEFEYEIDANTGDILDWDMDMK